MSYLKNKLFLALSAVGLSLLLTSCVKEDFFFGREEGDANRKQIVKLQDADALIIRARDVQPTVDEFMFLEVRRSPSTQAELNSPLTVTLAKNTAYLTSYNSANGTNYVEVPAANFTILDPLTVTFQPGETVKQIRIRVNKAGLNLSTQYALAYSISQVDAGGQISNTYKNALVAIIIKNKYDGHYNVTGSMIDYSNASLTGDYPFECDLETLGGNVVILYNYKPPFVGYYHPIKSGTSSSAYGQFVPVFIFDASDNIVAVENGYGQPSANGRSGELDPSGVNKWFASDKHMEVKYWMNQPAVITPHRVSFDENFEYMGPR